MAREKGTGSLQREKSGRWTVRVCVDGKRYSRSSRTRDRARAEAFLNKFLAPFGLGEKTIPLAEVWREYEKSPNRRELAATTMDSKRVVWMKFAEWIEDNHIEITQLKQLTAEAVAEYLRVFRIGHSASTYNNHVCVLREVCNVVAEKAGMEDDPWAQVRLLPDDSHCRREFSQDELSRLLAAAERASGEWTLLFAVGMYTGLRLGDCCRLHWDNINMERGIIQVIPSKTRKFAGGRPVTIPIHGSLMEMLQAAATEERGFVMPQLADWYVNANWRVDIGLKAIFKDAGIVTSVFIEGRRQNTPDATFHSLRHTFVSFSANAGVPLPVVQSIVGHTSTAMTRHYYHENEDALRAAVAAIPSLEALRLGKTQPSAPATNTTHPGGFVAVSTASTQTLSPAQRLKRLDRYFAKGILTEDELKAARARIIAEM